MGSRQPDALRHRTDRASLSRLSAQPGDRLAFHLPIAVCGRRRVVRRASLLADYGLVLQGWTGSLGVGWNTPAWSLSCELFFYLCFPVLLMFFAKPTWPRMPLAGAISIVLPSSLAQMHVPAWWKPFYHTADFLVGIVASHCSTPCIIRLELPAHRHVALRRCRIAGRAAGGVSPAIYEDRARSQQRLRPVNVAILIGLAIGGGLPARLLSTRILIKYLGQASYSMYILHVPLLWWYSRYIWRSHSIASQTSAAVLYIGIVIAISAAAFEWVEEPANRLIRRWM